jgi:glycosyltransferase involved in cell wall biosynthesis
MPRARVLAITSEPPWPLNSGGHLRTFHLLQALARSTDLRLLCPVESSQTTCEPLRDAGIEVVAVPVGARTPWGETQRIVGTIVDNEPYVLYRRHAWPTVLTAWREQIASGWPDVLYLDHLDSLLYRSAGGGIPSVIDLHNIYSLLVRRTAHEETNVVKRLFLRREAWLLSRLEHRAARECDALLAVSDVEAGYFRSLGATVHTVPNGVDCGALADMPAGRDGEPAMLFVGTMSWAPNAAAARFLAHDVLPRLRRLIPDATLLVVGREPPADLAALNGRDGVEVTGGVEDVKPYLRRSAVLAVPLEAGGGTRLKVLEAFAAGLPVVSTRTGVEGVVAVPDRDFVSAERQDFADAVHALLVDRAAGARLAASARKLAARLYDWPKVGAVAVQVIERLAAGASR